MASIKKAAGAAVATVRGALTRASRWLADVNNVRDVHVYGGGILAAVGLGMLHPSAGIVPLGVFLAWLGLRAPRR
jgi:hypothetical protein